MLFEAISEKVGNQAERLDAQISFIKAAPSLFTQVAGFTWKPATNIKFRASVGLDIRQNVGVVGIVEFSDIRSGPFDLLKHLVEG